MVVIASKLYRLMSSELTRGNYNKREVRKSFPKRKRRRLGVMKVCESY